MTIVGLEEHPAAPHETSTPSLLGAGVTDESQPVPSPFVLCSIAYELLSSQPVIVRVSPFVAVVRVISQSAAWCSMNG